MSYDISLVDENGETIQLDEAHQLKGGTYAVGGTAEAWLNITYNYTSYFHDVFGDGGIRTLYGKTGEEAIPLLGQAIDRLGVMRDEDYWAATPGNAGAALLNLRTLCEACPQGIIQGD